MIRERILGRANRQAAGRQQLTSRGAVDINQVDQALFREDLGFQMTNAGYQEYKRGEGLFGKAYDEVISSNTTALEQNQANLAKANEFLDSAANASIDKWYQEAQSGWTDVVVSANNPFNVNWVGSYSGDKTKPHPDARKVSRAREWWWTWQSEPTDKVQYTIKLPKDVADQVYSQMNKGDGTYMARWWGPKLYIGDSPEGTNDRYGKELNEALVGAENQVKGAFYEQALPKFQELQTKVTEAQTTKGELEKYINLSTDAIAEANEQKALRDTTKAAYKQQYEESKAHRTALFQPQEQQELAG